MAHLPLVRPALIAFLFVGVALASGSAVVQAQPHPLVDWCTPSTLSISPGQGYSGDTDKFTYTWNNNQGNAVSISNTYVTYSWDPQKYDLGNPTVPGDGSWTWTQSEQLGSVGPGTITVSIVGKASGDWLSATCNFNPWTFTTDALPPPPTVVASASPTTGTSPLTVSFTSTVTDGLGPFTYAWSFGDQSSASAADTTHTYTVAGTFTAQLVVTDSRGRSGSNTISVTVAAPSGNSPGGGNPGGGTPTGAGSSAPPPPDYTPYIIVGVVVVLLVVLAAVLLSRRGSGGSSKTPPTAWQPANSVAPPAATPPPTNPPR